jgi:4-amino-4-deoxy-L-arabinose transferase-like glycosyltransferase
MPTSSRAAWLARHRGACVGGLVLLAFALRIVGCALLGWQKVPESDDLDYDRLAWSLAHGEGYTIFGTFISFRPPLYPVLLSLVYRFAGHNYGAARVVQAGLGALSVWIAFLVGRRLFGEGRAFLAALLFAVAPADVFFSHDLLTETLFLPLLVAMAYGFVRLAQAARPGGGGRGRVSVAWALGAGALLGLATLTRPVLLLFPPFLLLWAWWTYRVPTEKGSGGDLRRVAGALSVIMLVALGVLTPWLWLVRERTGHWVPVTTGGGVTFWGGNNVQVMDREHWGRWVPITELPFYDELKVVAADQVEVDRRAWRLGLHFLAENPDEIPQLLLYKLARFWNPVANLRTSWKIIYFITYGLALPWMFAGMALSFRRDAPGLILHLLVGTFCLSALVFWGDARIRSGISPFLWMFAVLAADRALTRVRELRKGTVAIR